jgi:nucleoside-diphosphate-sugar epimerase
MKTDSDICVLGAGGLVGAAVCQHAGTFGHVRAKTDLSSPGASLAGIADGCTVVMAASQMPVISKDDPAFKTNMAMLAPLLAAAPAFVCYLSTDALYPFDSLITETTPPAPTSAYAQMHQAREAVLQARFADRLLILRMSQIYGPGDRHNAYGPMRMLRSARADGEIKLFGRGEERRDHLHVDDAAEAIVALIRARHLGTLNLASGQAVTFSTLASLVAQVAPAVVTHATRQQPVAHRDIDISALERAYPAFAPRDLATGLTETFQRISIHE